MEDNLNELVGLPEAPLVVFERPPLVLAICQLRFTPILGVADAAFVAPFQRAIQAHYPIASPLQEVSVEFQLGSGQPSVQQRPVSANRWQFRSVDGTWTVVLSTDSIGLETRAYSSFGEFIERFRDVITALVEHVGRPTGTRLGLRYVNEIRADSGYESAISRDLLGALVSPEFQEHAVHSFQQVLLRYTDRQGVNVRHGKFPGGTTVLPRSGQAADDRPFYLLDFDAYYEAQPNDLATEGIPVDADVLGRYLDGYNKAIYRLFRWAITEEYASSLGARERVG